MSSTEAVILVLLILWIPSMLATAMKERWILFAIAVVIFPVSYLGATMNAKPGSWWEQRQVRLNAQRPSQ